MKIQTKNLLCIASAALLFGAAPAMAFTLAPTDPGKWGDPVMGTPGGVVSYSFVSTGVSCGLEFAGCTNTSLEDFMPAGYEDEIRSAFDAWSDVADITFIEVSDSGLALNDPGAVGDIRMSGHTFDGPFGTLTHVFFAPNNGISAAGDTHFDIEEQWDIGFDGSGFDIFQVAAHEIGHAIGLDHTLVPSSLMNPFYTESFLGPQLDDILGAQFIYGVSPVPEPSTWLMLSLGLGMLWMRKKRAMA